MRVPLRELYNMDFLIKEMTLVEFIITIAYRISCLNAGASACT